MERSTKDFTSRKSPILPEGGKDPVERIVKAYGLSSRQALCRHLNVSQSTMANRIMRGNFPADWVLICSMETGASLEWLTYGTGNPNITDQDNTSTKIELKKISNGIFSSSNWVEYDAQLLPSDVKAPLLVNFEKQNYLVDMTAAEITDGLWLIEIDNLISVKELYRFPGGRIRVENGKASFECKADDIKVLGKVVARTEYL
ncbi:phage repressor protein C with HTH and peptisase S24 domain [Pantoea sp. PNA 14-12]|uniref:phage repressor protein CI n=1 Tax=Pantoea TaxID=53335 RepID=UPI001060079F|nr:MULTISPECIES: phage repressor protein CI [Pantoea]TDS68371.1 phage repressor protein C with HTH and peptisase S24 domain [Pantoea sp. PNA 14-12]